MTEDDQDPAARASRARGPTQRVSSPARPQTVRSQTVEPVASGFPLGPALLGGALVAGGIFAALRGGPTAPTARIALEPGFRAMVVRVSTDVPCTGRLEVQGARGFARELTEPGPVRDHRFVVDGLKAGEVLRFAFSGPPGAEPAIASAVGPAPPRLITLSTIQGAQPRILVEVTRPVDGELDLRDDEGNAAQVRLGGEAARHEIPVPPGNWQGSVTVRVQARSALGEVEALPPASLELKR